MYLIKKTVKILLLLKKKCSYQAIHVVSPYQTCTKTIPKYHN